MLFSRIGDFEGLQVADLFAGSGALGLEALSRGAEHCLFVDDDAQAIAAITGNAEKLGASGCATIRRNNVLSLGPAPRPLDMLMLDPPYGTSAAVVALEKLDRLGWIAPSAWISVETASNEPLDVAGFVIDTTRTVGKARLTLLRKA